MKTTKQAYVFPSSFFVYYFPSCTVSVCEFARPVLSPSVQAPGLKSVCPLKTYVSPHRRGGLASRLLEPTGKEQEERRGRGEDSRGVERRGKRERLFFSGPLPSILIGPPRALFPRSSGAEHGGDCPVIGTALSIRKNGTGKTQRHRRAQIPLPVSVWILCFDLKPSQIQKKKN